MVAGEPLVGFEVGELGACVGCDVRKPVFVAECGELTEIHVSPHYGDSRFTELLAHSLGFLEPIVVAPGILLVE